MRIKTILQYKYCSRAQDFIRIFRMTCTILSNNIQKYLIYKINDNELKLKPFLLLLTLGY